MTTIEKAIVENLQKSGPCSLDDIVTSLSNSSWGEVFLTVDRMSRDGRLVLRQYSYSAYQISLGPQFSPLQRLEIKLGNGRRHAEFCAGRESLFNILLRVGPAGASVRGGN